MVVFTLKSRKNVFLLLLLAAYCGYGDRELTIMMNLCQYGGKKDTVLVQPE